MGLDIFTLMSYLSHAQCFCNKMLFAGNNDEVDWNVQFSKGDKQNFKKT